MNTSTEFNGADGLEHRLIEAIKEENFSYLEIMGFKSKPEFSLLAGACIGYRLAVKDIEKVSQGNKHSESHE